MSRALLSLLCFCHISSSFGQPDEDRVHHLPLFGEVSFPLYSGMLEVPGPINGYDSLRIHYYFEMSSASDAPLVVWQQGGPGSSSIVYGAWTEIGRYRMGTDSTMKGVPLQNAWSWNRLAHVLYMDHPAGVRFSTCRKGGEAVTCVWDDVSQAEAFAHTLQTFFRKFADMSAKDLYIVGESYFGQYGTNIGSFIFRTEPFRSTFRLQGLGFGNACHGGNQTFVMCPGFNVEKNTVEFYFRHNFLSPSFYERVQRECNFPPSWIGHEVYLNEKCMELLQKMQVITAHRNVFFLDDTCDGPPSDSPVISSWRPFAMALQQSSHQLPTKRGASETQEGGFPYPCFVPSVVEQYLTSPKVANALHVTLNDYKASKFNYTLSGPAAIVLYPELMKQVDVMVFNGDADSLAIYPADQEWIQHFESIGVIKEVEAWSQWHTHIQATPAGFTTKYLVNGSSRHFRFTTVHGSGHMVPSFTPAAGLGVLAQLLGQAVPPAIHLPKALPSKTSFLRTNGPNGWDSLVEGDSVSHLQCTVT